MKKILCAFLVVSSQSSIVVHAMQDESLSTSSQSRSNHSIMESFKVLGDVVDTLKKHGSEHKVSYLIASINANTTINIMDKHICNFLWQFYTALDGEFGIEDIKNIYNEAQWVSIFDNIIFISKIIDNKILCNISYPIHTIYDKFIALLDQSPVLKKITAYNEQRKNGRTTVREFFDSIQQDLKQYLDQCLQHILYIKVIEQSYTDTDLFKNIEELSSMKNTCIQNVGQGNTNHVEKIINGLLSEHYDANLKLAHENINKALEVTTIDSLDSLVQALSGEDKRIKQIIKNPRPPEILKKAREKAEADLKENLKALERELRSYLGEDQSKGGFSSYLYNDAVKPIALSCLTGLNISIDAAQRDNLRNILACKGSWCQRRNIVLLEILLDAIDRSQEAITQKNLNSVASFVFSGYIIPVEGSNCIPALIKQSLREKTSIAIQTMEFLCPK